MNERANKSKIKNTSQGYSTTARSHSKNTDKNHYDRDSINGRDDESDSKSDIKFNQGEKSEISTSFKVSQ